MTNKTYRLETSIRDIPARNDFSCKMLKGDGDEMVMTKLTNEFLENVSTGEQVTLSTRKTTSKVLLNPDVLSLEDAKRYLASGFVWGEVKTVHVVGDYQVVEYYPRKSEKNRISQDIDYSKTLFNPYIDWEDTNHGYGSLDEALVGVIAYRAEGPNGQADMYFCKMVGIDTTEDED
jgi:hypothetical protein